MKNKGIKAVCFYFVTFGLTIVFDIAFQGSFRGMNAVFSPFTVGLMVVTSIGVVLD